ncbi:MAG: PilZ domain-containing protein, partial [Myxococcota bacterium]
TREPLTIMAEVVRDEGPHGLGLRFLDLDVAASEQVQRIVGTLPVVEDLSAEAGEEGHYNGVFFAEILDEGEDDTEKDLTAELLPSSTS